MRLVAIYIKKHKYLFDKPQTINFGGKFLYTFEEKNKEVIVSRKENEQFIDDFFNLENDAVKITMISAIVGQNGAGKSSLMNVIRSLHIHRRQDNRGRYSHKSLFLFENDKLNYPVINKYGFSKKVLLKLDKLNEDFEEINDNEHTHQSIYYRPQLDHTSNDNEYDLSFDKFLEKDLKQLPESENTMGHSYSANHELQFRNSLRQIEFLSSDLVNKNKIFGDIFHLPQHGQPLLTFRSYETVEDYPDELIQNAKRQVADELSKWGREKISDLFSTERDTKKTLHTYKNFLKFHLIEALVTLLEKQMELNRSSLSLKHFDFISLENELAQIQSSNEKEKPYKYLFFFAKIYENIDKGNVKAFDIDILKKLINRIYAVIDECSSSDEIFEDTLECGKEKAIEILTIQRDFLNDCYRRSTENHENIGGRLSGFVHYFPLNTALSSGENALLNLFSRLFSFLNDNFANNNILQAKDHYILILDEGDLGFHPTWKKKYIYALCKTLPYFFDLILSEYKPTFQIIITTHDSLTLSDLPNSNVVYMERRSYEEKSNVLNYHDKNRPTRTFGANITDLLADSFFIEKSLIGDFAHEKIKHTIDWLNSENQDESDKFKTIIDMIDEPILQRKLGEMYDEKMETELEVEIIKKQIQYLEKLQQKLKRKSN